MISYMLQYIYSAYKFKRYIQLLSILFIVNTTFASQISPDKTILVSTNNAKLCAGETTTISLSKTQIGVRYQVRDNHSGSFVSNTLIGNNSKASFEPFTPSISSSYTVIATHIASSEFVELSPEIEIEVMSLPLVNLEVSTSHNSLCVGESISVFVKDSEPDVYYQIEGGSNTNEPSFIGNGSLLSIEGFKPFRSATYRIKANRGWCETSIPLTNYFQVEVRRPPETQLYMYADKTEVCQGEAVVISLSPSDTSVDYQLCAGQSSNDENAIGPPITGNSGLINFNTVNPNVSTTYRVNAQGHYCINPVKVDFDIKIDVHSTSKTDRNLISDKTTICEGEALTISVIDSQEDVIYQLHDGADFLNTQVIGNGGLAIFPAVYPINNRSYSVYARDLICPDKLKLDKQVDFNLIKPSHFPIESFTSPGEVCQGETINIELPITQNGVRYNLYDKNISIETITSDGGPVLFENLITDIDSEFEVLIDNCVDEIVAAKPKLKIYSNPQIDLIITNEFEGSDGKVNVIVTDGEKPFTYIFENYKTISSGQRYIEVDEMKAGNYKLAVVDANYCKSTDIGHKFKIDFSNPKEYAVNGILTPNGDGRNDNWVISYNPEWEAPEVSVFNIYGQKVFHTLNYQNDWKGTYNSSQLTSGSYFYLIEFHRNNMKPVKGIVSILGRN